MYRTANPVLNDQTFIVTQHGAVHERMTLEGVATKTGLLLLLVISGASMVWSATWLTGEVGLALLAMIGGGITGFILALIIIFSGKTNPLMVSLYAAAQGFALGGLSTIASLTYPEVAIVPQAVMLTFGIFGAMLIIYRTGLISYSDNMRIALASAMGAIVMIYLFSFLLSFAGVGIPYIHGSGPIGIGFSLIVIGIASLSLVADFDFVEKGVEAGAPKELEWRAAFGLLVTLVWLYFEILRLLMKLNNRR
jgi:uncharacterized YccA/Bax inhibitor family protein